MKRLASVFMALALLAISVPAGATVYAKHLATVKDASGTAMSTYVIGNGNTVYTEPISVKDSTGFAVILLTVDASGSVTVVAEYSDDKTTWNEVYSYVSGVLTKDGNIFTTFGNGTRRLQYVPRLAYWVRFKVTAAADSTISLSHTYQEDR